MGQGAIVRAPEAAGSDCINIDLQTPRARGVVRWVRVTLAASSFFFFGLGGAFLGYFVLPLLWLTGRDPKQRRLRCQSLVQRAFRLFHAYMRACRLLEFDAAKAARDPRWYRNGAVVLVANHPTLIDTTAILSCLGNVCCVVTPWFGKNPLLMPLLRFCGHIVQKNDSLADRLRVVEEATARLKAGDSLLIFPEGTRSVRGTLGTFQRGGFELALRHGIALQPVAIKVVPHVLTGKTPWHDLPPCTSDYTLEPLEPWSPTEYPVGRNAARDMATQVRRKLAQHLRLPT